jgi:hypothetical protein
VLLQCGHGKRLGLAYPSAVGEHELMQMRASPARECGINRLGELTEAVGTGRSEYPARR